MSTEPAPRPQNRIEELAGELWRRLAQVPGLPELGEYLRLHAGDFDAWASRSLAAEPDSEAGPSAAQLLTTASALRALADLVDEMHTVSNPT